MPIEVWTPENAARGAVFVVVVATAAHVLLSRLGFNPSDDGFILAGCRRIRDGEVPHRDFISIRPALSHVLHVPVLLLGGDRAILLGRFVYWVQMASMAWIWSCLFPTPAPFASAALAFVLSAALFPPMPWHTVDALFLTTIGLSLISSPWGLLLAGLAPLCRQNFLLLLPVLAWMHGGLESVLLVVPGLAYVVLVSLAGGASDLWKQLTVYQGASAFYVGVIGYINGWSALGILSGLMAARPGAGTIVAALPAAWVLVMYRTGEARRMAYFVFGLGIPAALAIGSPVGPLVLTVGWVASLSIGYPYPAMAAGASFLMAAQAFGAPAAALIIASASGACGYFFLRRRYVYRQPSASALSFDLTGVLIGARGIRTSETTHAALADLATTITDLREKALRFAIVPDLPVYWACGPERNPISCDWPQDTELGSPALRLRVLRELDDDERLCVIVQKFETRGLEEGFVPLPERYTLVEHVRRTRPRLVETRFFTVLGPALPPGVLRNEPSADLRVSPGGGVPETSKESKEQTW